MRETVLFIEQTNAIRFCYTIAIWNWIWNQSQWRSNRLYRLCSAQGPSPGNQGPPTAWAVIFYASENTNYETAKNPALMKYTHQMYNAHEYFNLEIR